MFNGDDLPMNKKTVRIISIAVVLLLLFFSLSTSIYYVFAETDQEIINKSKKEQEEAQQAIDEKNSEKYAALSILNDLTDQVNSLQGDIDELSATLDNYNKEIDILNQEIYAATERISVQDDLIRKRLRVMDENGNIGVLDILLSATSFADLLDRIDTVRTITKYDQSILKGYKDAKKTVEDKKSELEGKMQKVSEAADQLNSKQDELKAKQNEKQTEVDKLSDLIAQYEANLAASKKAEEEANERIRQAAAEVSHVTASYNFTSGALNYPFASHYVVTSPFGGRISPISGKWEGHSGVDLGAPYGTPILASSDGVVITAGFNTGGYGNYVVIDHGGGIYTLYAHASSLSVSSGEVVSAGQHIANVGSTGWSTGPHLHFEVRVNGTCVDPAGYVPVY